MSKLSTHPRYKSAKRPRISLFDYQTVLEQLAEEVEAIASELGEGTILVITTGSHKGEPLVLTKLLTLPSKTSGHPRNLSWKDLFSSADFENWDVPND